MQEEEKEQDFGIPDDSGSKLEGWPSESDWNRVEATITQAPDYHEVKAKLPSRSKKTKARAPPKSDLTPFLIVLEAEITDTMDLLVLVKGTDQKTDILCRKVGNSLMRIQDLRDKLAEAVEG
jgi:hypothetical protein